jgi:hypothetical protein
MRSDPYMHYGAERGWSLPQQRLGGLTPLCEPCRLPGVTDPKTKLLTLEGKGTVEFRPYPVVLVGRLPP